MSNVLTSIEDDCTTTTNRCGATIYCLYTSVNLLNQELKHEFKKWSKLISNFARVVFIAICLIISGLMCYSLLPYAFFQGLKVFLADKKSQHHSYNSNCFHINSSTYKFISFVFLASSFTAVYSNKAAVVGPPQSVFTTLAIDSAEMTCKVKAQTIIMLVDGVNADQDSVRDMDIFLGPIQSDGGGFSSVTLTIIVNEALNNTMVQCVALNVVNDPSSNTSDPAYLIIEGKLPKPRNISVAVMTQNNQSSNCIKVMWLAPPTQFNTSVNGYNISSSLFDGPTFTSETNVKYCINTNDIDPCKEINITVTPFNGIEGDSVEVNGIYLPSQSSNISVTSLTVNSSDGLSWILFRINTKNLCPGSIPTSLKVFIKNAADDSLVFEDRIELIANPDQDDQLITKDVIELNETMNYKAIFEFCNNFGLCGFLKTIHFNNVVLSTGETSMSSPTEQSPNNMTSTSQTTLSSGKIVAIAVSLIGVFMCLMPIFFIIVCLCNGKILLFIRCRQVFQKKKWKAVPETSSQDNQSTECIDDGTTPISTQYSWPVVLKLRPKVAHTFHRSSSLPIKFSAEDDNVHLLDRKD